MFLRYGTIQYRCFFATSYQKDLKRRKILKELRLQGYNCSVLRGVNKGCSISTLLLPFTGRCPVRHLPLLKELTERVNNLAMKPIKIIFSFVRRMNVLPPKPAEQQAGGKVKISFPYKENKAMEIPMLMEHSYLLTLQYE